MTWLILLAGALLGAIAVVVALNFRTGEKRIERRLSHKYQIVDPQFAREVSALLGPPLVEGNHVDILENGDQIFPAMLEAIRSAKRTINFESYIYWSGEVGQAFSDALSERSEAGVAVRLLVDWAGSSKMESALVERMKAAGIEARHYHPLSWFHLARINNRTHRKILVVDGRIGFTGGVGIADQWQGHAQDPEHWRDLHFRFSGPVVSQAQSVFLDNWIKTTGDVLRGEQFFPPLEPRGEYSCQMFSSSVSGGSESMQLMYLMAISSAAERIDVASSYFVPDEATLKALVAARGRGVIVRFIVPGKHIDVSAVRAASRTRWGPLLESGVEIYEYQPTVLHSKLVIVDNLLVSVGSTNFDYRSLRLNDEASLNVMNSEFAVKMRSVFERDLAVSRRISLAEWRRRPFSERLREAIIFPLIGQL